MVLNAVATTNASSATISEPTEVSTSTQIFAVLSFDALMMLPALLTQHPIVSDDGCVARGRRLEATLLDVALELAKRIERSDRRGAILDRREMDERAVGQPQYKIANTRRRLCPQLGKYALDQALVLLHHLGFRFVANQDLFHACTPSAGRGCAVLTPASCRQGRMRTAKGFARKNIFRPRILCALSNVFNKMHICVRLRARPARQPARWSRRFHERSHGRLGRRTRDVRPPARRATAQAASLLRPHDRLGHRRGGRGAGGPGEGDRGVSRRGNDPPCRELAVPHRPQCRA